jgi:fumarate reductase subunit D
LVGGAVSGRGSGPSRVEPALWTLFSAGGVVSAFAGPALILAYGVLAPLGVLPADALTADGLTRALGHVCVRLALLAATGLTFFHAAHRFRFAVYDLGVKAARGGVAILCYGAALAGTAWAATILLPFSR